MRRRVEQHVPADGGRPPAQARPGRSARRRVQRAAAPARARPQRPQPAQSATTLEALSALARGGYVGREDAADLDRAYRLLRCLEHRIQLHRLRRTHLMPATEPDLRRLGRAMGHRTHPDAPWSPTAAGGGARGAPAARAPLLPAAAGGGRPAEPDEARLTPEAAPRAARGPRLPRPAGALRHIEALTTGVSRRAAIQRTLLPVMLGWFADVADPDAGLLAFRRVATSSARRHWYLGCCVTRARRRAAGARARPEPVRRRPARALRRRASRSWATTTG